MATRYRYIAFLRAVNVGGRVIKMDRLRSLFEHLGFTAVATFIASGNVIFETSVSNGRILERRIEQALLSEFGFEVETFIRTPAELAAALAHDPFADGVVGHTLSIGFLARRPTDDVRRMTTEVSTDVDDLRVHDREVYWRCHTRINESRLRPKQLERTLGMPSTMRNVTTLRKLTEKYAD